MGNSSAIQSIDVQMQSTKPLKHPTETPEYGLHPQIPKKKQMQKCKGLISLYPYLTYYKPLNNFSSTINTFQYIANIISEYIGSKQIIHHETFEMNIFLKSLKKKSKQFASNIILCSCSWNGLIYLISPVNNNCIAPNWYMIDGINSESKQIKMNEFPSKNITFDTNLCCIISHIVRYNYNKYDIEYIDSSNISSPMIIDGMILCNYDLNVIYGYSIINGLFIIKQFEECEPNLVYNYHTNKYEVQYLDEWNDEKVINSWRQNIDCFVLTNKLNLFGIKVTQKSFKIHKICNYKKDINDIATYSDCWYDIKTKLLFIIDKHKTVKFKIYTATKSFNLYIPNELQLILNKYYILSTKTFLFYHKPSNGFLLLFNSYIIEFSIDFERLMINSLNIGKINDFDTTEINVVNEMEYDGFKMNASNLVFKQQNHNHDLFNLMMKIKKMRTDCNVSICDFIIGYDELRGCIIINLNECKKELETLYKFKIFVMSINDLDTTWKQICL